MSGHSKWSTIKHKKAATDAKRGRIFTRFIKEITVAARAGGGDPDGNPRLKAAVTAAKNSNMPADNIKRAIQRGTGELPGVSYEEVVYEGYGIGGVAILLETLTDNRMRTTPEIRFLLGKHGGNLGEPGSVAWMFEKRGQFMIPDSAITEDKLLEIVIEAGADDLRHVDDTFEVSTRADAFDDVRQALERASIEPASAEIVMEAQTTVELEGKRAAQCLRLLDALEDHEDVQKVFANLEVSDDAS